MEQYVGTLKLINVFVIIAELFLVIVALMNWNLIFIEAVFKVALIIVYLQVINHMVLDERVEVFRALLSITSIIILFYTIVFLGKELLFALIILIAYSMFVMLSTPRNKLLIPNVIALTTPMLLALLLKAERIDVLYVLFLVATVMILQTNLVSTKLHLNISRIFDDMVAEPILSRLKESRVCNYIKPLFLKHIKFFYTKTIDSITKINNEVRNLKLKSYYMFRFLTMKVLYACSKVSLNLEKTSGSVIRILEDILQIAVRTEVKFEEYISKVAQLITKIEFIVEHFFILMLVVITTMLLITIIFYLISPLI